ncbi:MAG TPA: hypothetical protein VN419_03900 [Humidesulfovibrio sp.]|uniref:hypothetical protein n=1 Tax=Humidesulfovibrio sp. TaxID=2910988 RepID=UPI002CD69233|nr:hypothetical protein [Humidesulfovibrio sp.]HWR03142.1 hypothetical protein [Humidesulfovibrio sp.]
MDANAETSPQQPAAGVDSAELQTCLETPYEVRVREQAGRFTLAIPELGLLAQGQSLDAAYAALRQAKEQRIREYAAEGLLAWLPKADAKGLGGADQQPSLLKRLWPFLIKAAVVAALIMWAVGLINESTRNIGYGLEKKLDSVANWSPEDVELNRARAAKVAGKLGPLVRELLVMFRDDPARAQGAEPNKAQDAQESGQKGGSEQAGEQQSKK